jgi:hypothetical protein
VADIDGEWHGLLFDNPAIGLPPALTWTFRVDTGPFTVEVDWLPLPASSWRSMAGQSTTSTAFADPAEAIVYQGGRHYRFDRVDAQVTAQDGDMIQVELRLAGDIDGLGRETVTAGGRLRFTGIRVQLDGDPRERLAAFTDTGGLVEQPGTIGVAVHFTTIPPAGG